MLPVLAVLWIVSVAANVLALVDTQVRHTLHLVGSSTALALLILGIVWLFVSGQFSLGGHDDSPLIPLTKSDQRRIRRQLAGKAPLDFKHPDVVLKHAHQRRRQTIGALTIVAIELPNSLGLALADPDVVVLTLTSISLLLFAGLGVYSIAVAIRLKAPIRELTQATATSAPQ